MIVAAKRRQRPGADNQSAGHAKMDQPGQPAFEAHQDVFRPAVQPLGQPPFQAPGKVRREWKAQIRTPRLDADEPVAFDAGREAAAGGFDFGEFGHGVAEPSEAARRTLLSRPS